MRKLVTLLAIAGLIALGGQAFAINSNLGTIDNVPAATLLLPYFQVSGTCDPNGITTLFAVNNASAADTVAHVTVWTNESIPVLDFDIYLTGYDVQTINLRDVLCNGNLPATAVNDGSISNVGAMSFGSTDKLDTYSNCYSVNGGAVSPDYPPGVLASITGHLQAALTGNASPTTGLCYAQPTTDMVGYITIDDVHDCSTDFPSDANYFANNGAGLASNHDTLWGDYFYVDPGNNYAQGESLVSIEAQDGFGYTGGTTGAEGYTFYGRYTAVYDAGADNREPTATNFGIRHIVGGAFTGGTDLMVWRDSTEQTNTPSGYDCTTLNGAPGWEPAGLPTRQVVIFDEEENPVQVQGPPVSGVPTTKTPSPFPLETQRVAVGGNALPIPAGWESGWIYMNLNFPNGSTWHNTWLNKGDSPSVAQAWVMAVYKASGLYSIGLNAVQLDNATNANLGTLTVVVP